MYICDRNEDKYEFMVDLDDLNRLIAFGRPWHIMWAKWGTYYVGCHYYEGKVNGKFKYKTIYLHRWIMNAEKDMYVDHIDHNTLDNRRANLRLTTGFQNAKNRKGKYKNNSSGYRNVSWIESDKKYLVQLQVNGKNTRLGAFDDVHEAGEFARIKRQELYGEFAGED